MPTLMDRAVVIGAGIGGLFAAAAVAPHANEVVIVDSDDIPDTPTPRDGTPQSRHPHVLLFGGLDAMCEWFPGFIDDIVVAGGIPGVVGRDFVSCRPEGKSYVVNGYMPEPSDLGTMYVQTRPVLEACVRRRVLSLPNVRLRSRARVTGLTHDSGRVHGVRLADGDVIDADFTIEASGRQSRLPDWVEAMGFPRPTQQLVHCDIAYATATVAPDDWDAFPEAVIVFANWNEGEHPTRGGGFFRMAGGLWMVMLAGTHGDYPPTDWGAWCEFGRSVRYGPFSELIANVKPVDVPVRYRLPTARRWRYELLDRFPDGVLPIGDAVAFFNPIYGQGMSAAAGECRALHAALAGRAGRGDGLDGLAAEYLPAMAEWVRSAWALACAADFQSPGCTGDVPLEDMPAVEQLTALSLSTRPEDRQLSLDIGTLRKPLTALHELESA